jgi:hypothetical protein
MDRVGGAGATARSELSTDSRQMLWIRLYGCSDETLAAERVYATFADAMLGYVWIRFAASQTHYAVADVLLCARCKMTAKAIASRAGIRPRDAVSALEDMARVKLAVRSLDKRQSSELNAPRAEGSIRHPKAVGVPWWTIDCLAALDAMLYCLSAVIDESSAARAQQSELRADAARASEADAARRVGPAGGVVVDDECDKDEEVAIGSTNEALLLMHQGREKSPGKGSGSDDDDDDEDDEDDSLMQREQRERPVSLFSPHAPPPLPSSSVGYRIPHTAALVYSALRNIRQTGVGRLLLPRRLE